MDVSFPNPGETFAGKYRIESELGRGGFARVYRAMRIDLETTVALKIMRPHLLVGDEHQDPQALESLVNRFKQEARTISQLRSPQTVTMHDYGRTDAGMLYMVLEFIDGKTLTQLLETDGALAPERVVRILEQVLRGLHEAHEFGVLHRDIKPGNIMVFDHLGEQDLVKVLDFGIGKVIGEASEMTKMDLTADNQLLGTPRYLAPEYIRDAQLTPASDIYSLGLVTYELLTGERAIDANSSVQIIGKHLDPTPIELPRVLAVTLGLRKIVEKMAAKDPANRFSSAMEVLEALRAYKNGQDVTGLLALPPDAPQPAGSTTGNVPVEARVDDEHTASIGTLGSHRTKLYGALGAAVFVLGGVLAALTLWSPAGADEQSQAADGPQVAGEPARATAPATSRNDLAPMEPGQDDPADKSAAAAVEEEQANEDDEPALGQPDEAERAKAAPEKAAPEKAAPEAKPARDEPARPAPERTEKTADEDKPTPAKRVDRTESRSKSDDEPAKKPPRKRREPKKPAPSEDKSTASKPEETSDDDGSIYLPVE